MRRSGTPGWSDAEVEPRCHRGAFPRIGCPSEARYGHRLCPSPRSIREEADLRLLVRPSDRRRPSAGRARRLLALALVALSLALNPVVSLALNQLDLPQRLRPLAGPVAILGSLLILLAGVWVYLLNAAGETATPPQSKLNERDRRVLLDRVRGQVDDALRQPPGDPEPIPLGVACRSELVATPEPQFAERLGSVPRPLPVGQAFEAASGTLLILGEPGAGKTRLLSELARTLLNRAERDSAQPVPVLANLASWTPQALTEWLAGELQTSYDVPPTLGGIWVASGQVLPLLDGLDEADDPAGCAEEVNAFIAAQRARRLTVELAVCSRTVPYQTLGTRLRLGGAVELEAPTRQQIYDYLDEAGAPLPVVRAAIEDDVPLWGLLQAPLMLSVVTRAYRDAPAPLLPTFGTLEQRRWRLFEIYVDAMLTRRRTERGSPPPRIPYQRDQAVNWLGWLARSMHQRHQVQFHLDRLQPAWLPRTGRLVLHWTDAVAVGLGRVSRIGSGVELGGGVQVEGRREPAI
jgi:hypothetical protein